MMSWQENLVLQRTSGASGPQEESGAGPQGDSKILRYIKTLTSRQANTKQQRMDQYLQQVKHTRPVKYDMKSWKSSRHSSTTGSLRHDETLSKVPSTQLVKEATAREQHKLPGNNSVVQNDHSIYRGKLAKPKDDKSLPLKRSYEGKQSYRQQKKRASSKQQAAVIESLDRFRLNDAWSQDRSQTSASEYSGKLLASTRNKTAQQILPQRSIRQAQTPRAANPVFDNITAGLNQRGTEKTPVEVLKPLPAKAFTAHTTSTAVQDPRNNSIRHSFLSLEEEQQGNLDCALEQEAFVTAYDPLSATMELIYF